MQARRERHAGEGERRTRAVAEADGEAVRVRRLHAAREAEGAEGGGGEEVRGEALHAVLRDLVLGEVEVLERVEGVEQLGERVEVGAAVWVGVSCCGGCGSGNKA